jgi:hypothetical protein
MKLETRQRPWVRLHEFSVERNENICGRTTLLCKWINASFVKKMNTISREASKPMLFRLRKSLLSVMPVPRKYGTGLVSMVEKCHTGLSKVLWSCKRPCYYTPPIAHAWNKEKKNSLPARSIMISSRGGWACTTSKEREIQLLLMSQLLLST